MTSMDTSPTTAPSDSSVPTVALTTLGCARNDVDSEELAARLEQGGFRLVDDPDSAQTVVVNTCGFIAAAKKDSVDAVLEAAELKGNGTTQAVVAVGCLAERYGRELADTLPEADAVLGFDDYPNVAARLRDILDGRSHVSHAPRDRRTLLPVTPVARAAAVASDLPPGMAPASGPRAMRRRLGSSPMAPLKLASGCDRRCAFCAIPSFRGSFVSRPADDVFDEARHLAGLGVRELFLVSENSTSYGKDLGDLRLLEALLPRLVAVDGVARVRVSYLQPAEMRPGLVSVIGSTPGVAPYYDLSFQHASGPVLRRMRRFGDADRFLGLLEQVRNVSPLAGVRSNVIVGFPGETEQDVQVLCDFLAAAKLDAVGVFGYSDEDGTEAAGLDSHVSEDEIGDRVDHVTRLAEQVTDQRAEDRLGEAVEVLIEHLDGSTAVGRAGHQGPEVDGEVTVTDLSGSRRVGDLVTARVTGTSGVDLVAAAVRP